MSTSNSVAEYVGQYLQQKRPSSSHEKQQCGLLQSKWERRGKTTPVKMELMIEQPQQPQQSGHADRLLSADNSFLNDAVWHLRERKIDGL